MHIQCKVHVLKITTKVFQILYVHVADMCTKLVGAHLAAKWIHKNNDA